MRPLALALTLTVPLFAVPTQPAAGAHRTCAVKGSKTVVKNRFARVFTVDTPRRADEELRLYGCLHSTNKRTLLDTSRDDGFGTTVEFKQVKLAGRFVAWEHVVTDLSCRAACPPDYDPTMEVIGRTDLRSRRTRAIEGTPRAGSLTVDRSGRVRWIDDPTGERRSGP